MNFNLNIDDYSKDDYLEIFDVNKDEGQTKSIIQSKYETLLNNVNSNEDLDEIEKNEMSNFLCKCKDNLFKMLNEDNSYKLINNNFTQNLNTSDTFQSNNKFIIKKQTDLKDHTNKINPFVRKSQEQLININTRFRKNYYTTNATDFIVNLPEEYKNVISLNVHNIQIPKTYYTFSSVLGTNEFSLELFDINKSNGQVVDSSQIKKIIKILNGVYDGESLANYLNTFVFSDISLNRIGCAYDNITKKFRFFRDYRTIENGGQPPSDTLIHAFNIDWRLAEDKSRPIQLNMGWILGYRQQYYNWYEDFTDSSGVTFNKQEGYNPEAVYDTLGSKYYILSINDFNKNYSTTLSSPFQDSVFNDHNAIAKIPINTNLINFDDTFQFSIRKYFGPVNIKKLEIKLFDELGRIIDLNNNDFSFTILIKQLYDIHATKDFD
tara:strand:+ start:3961 stop:5265 length:1305 start_codon:yes stop_codon:yes gene_type:complete